MNGWVDRSSGWVGRLIESVTVNRCGHINRVTRN